LIPTIDLVTLSDIWTTTIQVRLVYHNLIKLLSAKAFDKMTFSQGIYQMTLIQGI
jgi:hypothetical protein